MEPQQLYIERGPVAEAPAPPAAEPELLAASDLLGMPVVALDTGTRLGRVTRIHLATEQQRITGFTVQMNGGVRAREAELPFEALRAIGRDAITIPSRTALIEGGNGRRHAPGLHVLDKSVLTESGDDLGRVSDVLIRPRDGQVVGYEVSGGLFRDIGTGRGVVPAPEALVVGDDYLIVPAATEERLGEPGGLQAAWLRLRGWAQVQAGRVSGAAEERLAIARERPGFVEEREVRYLRGKRAPHDLRTEAGEVVVRQGETFDDATLDRLRHAGLLGAAVTAVMGWETRSAGERAWGSLRESVESLQERYHRSRVEAEQIEFLRGKVAANTVLGPAGEPIVREGEVLTPAILDHARETGVLEQIRPLPEPEPGPVDVVVHGEEEMAERREA